MMKNNSIGKMNKFQHRTIHPSNNSPPCQQLETEENPSDSNIEKYQ